MGKYMEDGSRVLLAREESEERPEEERPEILLKDFLKYPIFLLISIPVGILPQLTNLL